MTNIKELVSNLHEVRLFVNIDTSARRAHELKQSFSQAADLLEKLIPQPIETAPRDETDVWLYDVDYDDYPHVGYYDPECGWCLLERTPDNFNPTHWWPANLLNVEGE